MFQDKISYFVDLYEPTLVHSKLEVMHERQALMASLHKDTLIRK